MSTLFSVLPVLLGFSVATAIAKLAAWLYRRSTLKWRHAAGYVLLLFIGSIILAVVNKLGGSTSPLPLLIGASLAFHTLLGGWYLGSRSRGADGGPLTFPRGAILALINFGLILAIMGLPTIVLFALRA